MDITYPTRCVIVDPEGSSIKEIKDSSGEVVVNLVRKTPAVSLPHVGKEGLAEMVDDPEEPGYQTVRITLDDGTVLDGSECWWTPLKEGENGSSSPVN